MSAQDQWKSHTISSKSIDSITKDNLREDGIDIKVDPLLLGQSSIWVSGNLFINGDLIVLGSVRRGVLIPLSDKDADRCRQYFSSKLNLVDGRDYARTKEGIMLREEDLDSYKKHIVEALI